MIMRDEMEKRNNIVVKDNDNIQTNSFLEIPMLDGMNQRYSFGQQNQEIPMTLRNIHLNQ